MISQYFDLSHMHFTVAARVPGALVCANAAAGGRVVKGKRRETKRETLPQSPQKK